MFALWLPKAGLYYHQPARNEFDQTVWRKNRELATTWADSMIPAKIVEFWTLGELDPKTGKRTSGKAIIGGYSGWDVEVVELS